MQRAAAVHVHHAGSLALLFRSGLDADVQFPLSAAMTHPVHDPHYYDRMRDGVHRSQQGISRSWWKRFFQVRGDA